MNGLLFGINWETLENIKYFPLILIVFLFLIIRYKKSTKIITILSVKERKKELFLNYSPFKKLLKIFLFLIGLLFLFLSLLSPTWDEKQQEFKQEGREIFIALDISRSMLAKDFSMSRLELSKKKIKTLLNLIDTDRISLILFSGTAFVQCPLTRDFAVFESFLDSVDVELISSGTTAIDQAINLVLKKCLENSKKNKLLLIFTDGEDFSSDLAGVKQRAQKDGLHIFSIGVATEQGAPIPLYDDKGKQIGNQLDKNGKIVITRLNEGILKALSTESGGCYVKITKNDDDTKEIIKKILEYEKESLGEKEIKYYEQKYPYFVAVSFLCFALDWLL